MRSHTKALPVQRQTKWFVCSFLLLSIVAALPALAVDLDNDLMQDEWETVNGLNPADPLDAALDGDTDGLTNLQEHDNLTDPNNRDTDYDWLTDGFELLTLGSDPTNPDSDDDQIPDWNEGVAGLDMTDWADGLDDLDADGVENVYEHLTGYKLTDAASVPEMVGNYSEDFEIPALPKAWSFPVPPESVEPWQRRCTSGLGYAGSCGRVAGRLEGVVGESVLHFSGNFRPSTVQVKLAWYTTGSVLILVDGVRVFERSGWGIWNDFAINLSGGSHIISFVHRNTDGSAGGLLSIDEFTVTEVLDLYSTAANNRFCADVQQYMADTWLTPVNVVEPDFDTFVSSRAEPWAALPPTYPANDVPLTTHQLTTTGENPLNGNAEFVQLLSCKTKRWDGLNDLFGPPDVSGTDVKGCRDVNMLTFERVIAGMSVAEVQQASGGSSNPDDIVRPIFDADQGGYLTEWIYDAAYLDGSNNLHVQGRQLESGQFPPFPTPPSTRGVHYCHLIAPEYARGLLLGDIPVIDNAPAGRIPQ
ncbi:MAG: hypothetical protein ACR2P6_10590 [Gammaproteobacteria bacterium]